MIQSPMAMIWLLGYFIWHSSDTWERSDLLYVSTYCWLYLLLVNISEVSQPSSVNSPDKVYIYICKATFLVIQCVSVSENHEDL